MVLLSLLLQNPASAADGDTDTDAADTDTDTDSDTDTDTDSDTDTDTSDTDTDTSDTDTALSDTDVDYTGLSAAEYSGEAGGKMACATIPAATLSGLGLVLGMLALVRRRA